MVYSFKLIGQFWAVRVIYGYSESGNITCKYKKIAALAASQTVICLFVYYSTLALCWEEMQIKYTPPPGSQKKHALLLVWETEATHSASGLPASSDFITDKLWQDYCTSWFERSLNRLFPLMASAGFSHCVCVCALFCSWETSCLFSHRNLIRPHYIWQFPRWGLSVLIKTTHYKVTHPDVISCISWPTDNELTKYNARKHLQRNSLCFSQLGLQPNNWLHEIIKCQSDVNLMSPSNSAQPF